MTVDIHSRRLALFHPWPQVSARQISGRIKNILLFFDGMALLAPPALFGSLADDDRSIVETLVESDLFHLLSPSALMDSSSADRIMAFLSRASASFEARAQYRFTGRPESGPIPGLLDWVGVGNLTGDVLKYADSLWHELFCRGLAADARASFPRLLHPSIWGTIEALLAYTLRSAGSSSGLDLRPVTDDSAFVDSTMRLWGHSSNAKQAQLIASNLEEVAPDLSDLPLDQVLDFRAMHGAQFRSYMEQLYMLVVDFAAAHNCDQDFALAERYSEIAEAAEDLRRITRKCWRRPISMMGLAIFGTTWKPNRVDATSTVPPLFNTNICAPGADRKLPGSYSYLIKERWNLWHADTRPAQR